MRSRCPPTREPYRRYSAAVSAATTATTMRPSWASASQPSTVRVRSFFSALSCGRAPLRTRSAARRSLAHPLRWRPVCGRSRPGFFASPGTPHSPLVRTLLRAGLETPARLGPIFRASVGGGFIWGSRPAPVAAGSIALSSGGEGKRAFVELEHDVTRVREAESRFRYRQDSTVQTPLGTSVVTERIHPTWTTLRVGLELPLP